MCTVGTCTSVASFCSTLLEAPEADRCTAEPELLQVPYFAVSGLTVRYLKVQEESGSARRALARHPTPHRLWQFRSVCGIAVFNSLGSCGLKDFGSRNCPTYLACRCK